MFLVVSLAAMNLSLLRDKPEKERRAICLIGPRQIICQFPTQQQTLLLLLVGWSVMVA
jgi:hypothetical protein